MRNKNAHFIGTKKDKLHGLSTKLFFLRAKNDKICFPLSIDFKRGSIYPERTRLQREREALDMKLFILVVLCLTAELTFELVEWVKSILWGEKDLKREHLIALQIMLEFFLALLCIFLHK